jgi:circadian clock protein KaiB
MKRVASPKTKKKTASRTAGRKAASPRPRQRRAAAAVDYDLVLFISGASDRSRVALANIKAIVNEHLDGRYRLSVVDLYQQPQRAREHEIIAVPTLVKRLPQPLRRMIGDLSDEDRVMIGLDIVPKPRHGRG